MWYYELEDPDLTEEQFCRFHDWFADELNRSMYEITSELMDALDRLAGRLMKPHRRLAVRH